MSDNLKQNPLNIVSKIALDQASGKDILSSDQQSAINLVKVRVFYFI